MSDDKIQNSSGESVPCLYFHTPGPKNTGQTLKCVARRADELDIQNIVVATTTGKTGAMASRLLASGNLVVVTHSTGFVKPNFQELLPEYRQEIEKAGARLLTCQHAFGGVNRAVRRKLSAYELDEIIAYTLRLFGEGTKVAVEIALMASDAGLIPAGEPCISVGGTGRGADTAVLLRAANVQDFFDLKIMEILAKPRL